MSACNVASSSVKLPPAQTQTAITAYGNRDPAVILGRSPETGKILALIRAGGYAAYIGGASEIGSTKSVLVSGNAHLSLTQIDQIKTWTTNGGNLVSFNRALNESFGLKMASPERIVSTRVPFLNFPVKTPPNLLAPTFAVNKDFSSVATAVSVGNREHPMIMKRRYGHGYVLSVSVDLFEGKLLGYELVPSLARMIGAFAKPARGPLALMNTVYLDPGTLPLSLKTDFAQIAQDLIGYRAVEIAAWDSSFVDPSSNYPYQRLINALHDRGILAYAWIEPPFVNLYMWQTYPQCRELTATGAYAIGDWRKLIALEDPSCFSIAWSQWKSTLTSFAWDGVNIAELYFEPPTPLSGFTPFSKAALTAFGQNPMSNLAGFLKFRENLVASLDSKLLAEVNGLPNAKELGIQLTVIDDSLDKKEALDIGSNLSLLSRVAKAGGATLQVEDPYTVWTSGPDRYFEVAKYVRSLMPASSFSIDINDVNRGSFATPTATPTFGELDLGAMAAGSVNGQVSFYEFGTISPYDLSEMGYSVGGSTIDFPNGIKSAFAVAMKVDPSFGRLSLDGRAWPVGPGVAIVPSGEHNLVWGKGRPTSPGILWFDANLGTAQILGPKEITFTYFSHTAAYVLLTQKPLSMQVDSAPFSASATLDSSGGSWVRLPAGTHSVVVDF